MTARLRWYSFRWKTGIVLVVAGALCWYWLAGRYWHPVGAGPAGPRVDSGCFRNPWREGKTLLVGLGDSMTAGFGASDGHSYLELLVENDDSDYPDMEGRDLKRVFPDLDVLDYSRSYTVSQECLDQQVPMLSAMPAEIRGLVVITTGGNDIIHDYGRSAPRDGAMYGCTYEQAMEWKENYRDRLSRIIAEVTDRFPGGCEIFVANVYDPTDGVGDIENASLMLPAWPDALKVLSLVNAVISEVCSAHDNAHLVDIHSTFLGHGIHCRNRRNRHYRSDDPYYWYFDNLEDPNDRGYDAIRRLFLIEMAKVFCGTTSYNGGLAAPARPLLMSLFGFSGA